MHDAPPDGSTRKRFQANRVQRKFEASDALKVEVVDAGSRAVYRCCDK
jgi:hypothetical protein